jgi:nucleoid DNA-binding protein
MATAKKTAASTASKKAVKPTVKAAAPKAPVTMKPIKTVFNKTSLIAHLAETAGLEPKQAKAFMAALESTVLASVHKKGLGGFTLPGLMKVTALQVPAKKKRVGIDPFTKIERTFAAKPATTKIKVRALKKLKDAAL